jgi:hypothetical protein
MNDKDILALELERKVNDARLLEESEAIKRRM